MRVITTINDQSRGYAPVSYPGAEADVSSGMVSEPPASGFWLVDEFEFGSTPAGLKTFKNIAVAARRKGVEPTLYSFPLWTESAAQTRATYAAIAPGLAWLAPAYYVATGGDDLSAEEVNRMMTATGNCLLLRSTKRIAFVLRPRCVGGEPSGNKFYRQVDLLVALGIIDALVIWEAVIDDITSAAVAYAVARCGEAR